MNMQTSQGDQAAWIVVNGDFVKSLRKVEINAVDVIAAGERHAPLWMSGEEI